MGEVPAVGPAASAGYGVRLALCLPRDRMSVPVVRRLVRYALEQVGVLPAILEDILLAVTEACANVLQHSGPGDAYDVNVNIDPDRCEVRIIDVGHGFDHRTIEQTGTSGSDLDAERGRGLVIMHALVDHVELVSEPESGTLVRLVKHLEFDEATPARRLLRQVLGDGRSA